MPWLSSNSPPMQAVPNMEVEGMGESLNIEAVDEFNAQNKSSEEYIKEAVQAQNNSSPSFLPELKSNLWSNDPFFLSKFVEIDQEINNPNLSQTENY